MAAENLSAKTLLQINDAIMEFDPIPPVEYHPKAHNGLNPLLLTMRQEIHTLQKLSAQNRKTRLLQQLKNDFLQEEKDLREVGLAYTNTQY